MEQEKRFGYWVIKELNKQVNDRFIRWYSLFYFLYRNTKHFDIEKKTLLPLVLFGFSYIQHGRFYLFDCLSLSSLYRHNSFSFFPLFFWPKAEALSSSSWAIRNFQSKCSIQRSQYSVGQPGPAQNVLWILYGGALKSREICIHPPMSLKRKDDIEEEESSFKRFKTKENNISFSDFRE